AAGDSSFARMADRQRAISDIVLRDPDVDGVASLVSVGTVGATSNAGRLYIALKLRKERRSSAAEIMGRLRAAAASVPGVTLLLQAAQEIQLDARVSPTQYRYALQDTDSSELSSWAPRLVQQLQRRPELRDVATDQQTRGRQVSLVVYRDKAALLGVSLQAIDDTLYDAFGQRQISTIFTQLNQYRIVLEVEPRYRESPFNLSSIYVKSASGEQVPLSAIADFETAVAPLSI